MIQQKLRQIQNRFAGALEFLKKTNIQKNNQSLSLNTLPWHLLIGFDQAGKTSFLTNSDVQFVLQKQFSTKNKSLENTEDCDWWVTKEACIIDVPGKYLSFSPDENKKLKPNTVLWSFFLQLIRQYRGKQGISSIIIALPLAELISLADSKNYQVLQYHLFHCLRLLQNQFTTLPPCHLVITKCDLLPGFTEFFADLDQDEITQIWGTPLDIRKDNKKLEEVFDEHFNALIKRLNQQLIYRLHHERNPLVRPLIKDFPLQVEQLKRTMQDFIKKFSSLLPAFTLQGVYLTSAVQHPAVAEVETYEQAASSHINALQVFTPPAPTTRPYFIKQFITHRLNTLPARAEKKQVYIQKKWVVYATAVMLISSTTTFLVMDFKRGVNRAYAVEHQLTNYQLAVKQIQDPNVELKKTVELLNTLKPAEKISPFHFDISQLFSFYSLHAQKKSEAVYLKAVKTIFLPEIKNYIEDYLKLPVNKSANDIYAALASYLMLGNLTHLDPQFFASTINLISKRAVGSENTSALFNHLQLAARLVDRPIQLDEGLVKQTRGFLIARPELQLAYLILSNMHDNNIQSEINFGTQDKNMPLFTNDEIKTQIPLMFTTKNFSKIMSNEITASSIEAINGNWVIGENLSENKNVEIISTLTEQLRTFYLNQYINRWEKLLPAIQLAPVNNLAQADKTIVYLMSNHSPLLQFLQTYYDNTFFEPIASLSPKLQELGLLFAKQKQSEEQLYQIFAGLLALHQYLQTILHAENIDKAAFVAVSERAQQTDVIDAITQLKLIANKNPTPIKNWLNQLADNIGQLLMQRASLYLNTAWQQQVIFPYQTNIAGRYPFNISTDREVTLSKFSDFFGNPGIIYNFYKNYLITLIDSSKPGWQWKTINGIKIPFSNDTLRQIQYAFQIHQIFFPYDDNKPYVQFSLQPYQFDANIKKVKLTINDKEFIDENQDPSHSHTLLWPSIQNPALTSVQLFTRDKKISNQAFSGSWGWFKLVNASFEKMSGKKEMIIRFSGENTFAKYSLLVARQPNPFIPLNLNFFKLPKQL